MAGMLQGVCVRVVGTELPEVYCHVDGILGGDIEIPAKLQAFMKGTKQSVPMSKDFATFKEFLMKQ